jgi:hypothetical protein
MAYSIEDSMKKRLNRNKYKVQREFQSMNMSINKQLRELGAQVEPSDCGDATQRENNNNLSKSVVSLKKTT